jgi:GWxTD domain-containing protein
MLAIMLLKIILPLGIGVDLVPFKTDTNLVLYNVTCIVPYSELSYKPEGDSLKASFKIRIKVIGIDNKEKYQKEWEKVSYITSHEEAIGRDLHLLLDPIRLLLNEGKYKVLLEIVSKKTTRIEKQISVTPFSDTLLTMSGVELATSIMHLSLVSGASFVDSGNGDYIRQIVDQDTIYEYVGHNQGDWVVRFTNVGERKGDYEFDEKLGKMKYVGTNTGSYVSKIIEDVNFRRGNLQVIPNPEAVFNERNYLVYTYAEIYNLEPEKEYSVFYTVLSEQGDTIKKLPPNTLAPPQKDVIEIGGVNVITLDEGTYLIKIEVIQGDRKVSREKTFYMAGAALPEITEFTEKERQYYDFIDYIATKKELEFYRSLSDVGKKEFLRRFWFQMGRDVLHEFISRIEYADTYYTTGPEKGRHSDRGRIYIKYGKPDETERYPSSIAGRASERWFYYERGGVEFIFVDKRGYGEYELVYSSIEEEPTDPNWEDWVDPSLIR